MEDKFYRHENNVVLEMNNVSLSFDSNKKTVDASVVISGFNLKVHQGEFVVLVGPSGCGKTTLLSLMAGILKATSGELFMLDEPIKGPDWRREIVFQQPTLYPWYDVHDNVSYGLKIHRVKKEEIDRRVKDILQTVGLSDYIHAKTYELSGGMKQRVALARVLINKPDIILMDEPFSALDAFTRSNMQTFLRDEIWRKTGCTIVLITHDVDEALQLASRIVVLSKNPCKIMSEYNAMFATPLHGNASDDTVMMSEEYIGLRRKILNLLTGEI